MQREETNMVIMSYISWFQRKLLFYPQFSAVRRCFFTFNIYKLKKSRNNLTIRGVTCLAIFSRITTFSVSIRSSRQELHHPFTSCCSFVVHHGKLLMISRSPNVQFHQFANFFPTYSLRTSSSLPASHRPSPTDIFPLGISSAGRSSTASASITMSACASVRLVRDTRRLTMPRTCVVCGLSCTSRIATRRRFR